MAGYVQVQARYLIPGWTIVVPEGHGRHRKGGAGLAATFYIEAVQALSNSSFVRLTGRQGNAPATLDLKATQVVKVQH